MDEKRRLLAYASAGALNIDLTLGDVARAKQALQGLSGDDVVFLGTLVGLRAGDIRVHAERRPDAYAALVAAGCIPVQPASDESVVTPLGKLVLRVTSGYITARGPAAMHRDGGA
ncbi:MAG: hypothetical protein RL385_3203 [Pseudomonadota bacterium]|jgi:hypothetical protein